MMEKIETSRRQSIVLMERGGKYPKMIRSNRKNGEPPEKKEFKRIQESARYGSVDTQGMTLQ